MTPCLIASAQPVCRSANGRVSEARVRKDQSRLVERADQVFTCGMVDAGFPANRAIDHRQHRRRKLYQRDAAKYGRGDESRQVAHHATAEGKHDVATFDAPFEHPGIHVGDDIEILDASPAGIVQCWAGSPPALNYATNPCAVVRAIPDRR